MSKFPLYKQKEAKDCGPTCLKIIAKYCKKTLSIQALRELSETTREGSNLFGLSEAAEKKWFRSFCIKVDLEVKKKLSPLYQYCWKVNNIVLSEIKRNLYTIFQRGDSKIE